MMDEDAASIVAQIKNASEIIDQVCENNSRMAKTCKELRSTSEND